MFQQSNAKLIIIILLVYLSWCSKCTLKQQLSKLRANYKNAIDLQSGAIISTRKSNYFEGGFDNGLMIRDSLYIVSGVSGMTSCYRASSIEIVLLQTYQLNTLFIWLWDLESTRFYDFVIYAKYMNIETLIFDTIASRSFIEVNFIDQFVQSFRFFNRNGSNVNPILHIIKVEAFYKL